MIGHNYANKIILSTKKYDNKENGTNRFVLVPILVFLRRGWSLSPKQTILRVGRRVFCWRSYSICAVMDGSVQKTHSDTITSFLPNAVRCFRQKTTGIGFVVLFCMYIYSIFVVYLSLGSCLYAFEIHMVKLSKTGMYSNVPYKRISQNPFIKKRDTREGTMLGGT